MTRKKTRNPASFGEKLKALQADRELTNEQAANELGVGLRLYQLWRSGKRPGFANLVKVARFYGVSVSFLLDDAERRAA